MEQAAQPQRSRRTQRLASPLARGRGLVMLAVVAALAPLRAALLFSTQLLRPSPSALRRRGAAAQGVFGAGPLAGDSEARTLLRAARKKKAEVDAAEEKPAKKKAAAKKAEPKDDRDPNDFYPGDRVKAQYHKDGGWYEAVVLYKKEEEGEVWDISWDEPDEGEQITSIKRSGKPVLIKRGPVGLADLENVPLGLGDKVSALFIEEQKWYDAVLDKMPTEEGGKYTVKWDDPDGSPPTAELERHDIKLKLRKL